MHPLLYIIAAVATSAPQESARPVNFVDDVQPILREHCLSCHRGSRARNGLDLKTMRGVLSGGSSGASVVPGDASSSLLYLVMTHERSPNMPPEDDRLPDELLETIRVWIDEGCRETATSEPGLRADTGPAFEPVALPTGAGSVMPTGARTQPVWSTERANTITAIAVSPGAPLAAVSGHRQVTLFNLEDEEVLAVLPFPEGDVHSLRFSPTGAVLMGGGGRAGDSGLAVAWDVATGERLFAVGEEPDVVLDADISYDHSTVILGGPDRVVRAYSTASGELLYELSKHNDWVTACAFSPDGVLLATADRAGGLFIWEAQTGREFHQLEVSEGGINALDWRADSMVVAIGSDRGSIRQYEMENGNRTRQWTAHDGVLALDFLADGRIATAGRNGFAVISNADGSRSHSFSKAAAPVTAIGSTRDGAHVLVGTLVGGLRHCVGGEKQPVSFMRVNPKTNEERAVERHRAHLAALDMELPQLETSLREGQISLEEVNAQLPEADARAAQTVTVAQAAAQRASTARAEERVSAERAGALEGPLPLKEAASLTAAEEESALQSASAAARAALEEAIHSVSEAEESAALSPEDVELQSALQERRDVLSGALAVAQLAELELAKAAVSAHSAQAELTSWRARLERHLAEHAALKAKADAADQVAAQAQADAANAAAALEALQIRQRDVTATLADKTAALDRARAQREEQQLLLDAALPAWEALREHLMRSGGEVPQAEAPSQG